MKKVKCPQCNYRNPQDKQFCQRCLYNIHYVDNLFSIKNQPRWVSLQNNFLKTSGSKMDPKYEKKMQDYIESEKKKELKTSLHARKWEAGRKREWKANKKYYIKNGGRF